MKLLGLDFETTGLDIAKDKIIEVGAIVWDTDYQTPVKLFNEFVWSTTYSPLPKIITDLTGISEKMLDEYGSSLATTFLHLDELVDIYSPEYIVAHNGRGFDQPFMLNEMERHQLPKFMKLRNLPWLDTRLDIKYDIEPQSRKLIHLALDQGFINPFPHRAVTDVLTMFKVLSKYKIEDVIAYSKEPSCVVRALVDYDNREKAKEMRYTWEQCGDKKFPKQWVKLIKRNEVEAEIKKCSFQIAILD